MMLRRVGKPCSEIRPSYSGRQGPDPMRLIACEVYGTLCLLASIVMRSKSVRHSSSWIGGFCLGLPLTIHV
ncbi:hypothetical protein VTK56DRAFT_6087 [Thermocarpiscus australiensis]